MSIRSSSSSVAGDVIPVRVAVRIRPMSSKELDEGCEVAIDKPIPETPQINVVNGDKGFTYDFAYNSSTEQNQVFTEVVKPLEDQLLKGYNATI